VLDLYRIDLAGEKNRDVVAELASDGQARLADVPADVLSGAVATRQRLQIECTATGREYIGADLKGLLLGHPYPLHFIDFEGSRLAIPYHAGMQPYEQASFQWSCHTIRAPEARIDHADWLNDQDAFPNFAFARTLRNEIGDDGTVYIWSQYELSVLSEIANQLVKYGQNENETDLAQWIARLLVKENPRVVDLWALAKELVAPLGK